MMTGRWPEYVDHKDRNGLNNKWNNIREVTSSGNSCNRSKPSNNSSGVVGVHWMSGEKVWRAKIFIRGRYISLGRHHDFDEAVKIRKLAERQYNFYAGHGSDKIHGTNTTWS